MKKSIVRPILNKIFEYLCICSSLIGILALLFLLFKVVREASPWLDWQFLTSSPSRFPEKAGIYPLVLGSFALIVLVSIFALPIGVCSAIYLEEYSPRNALTKFIEINISNLAGVPSIVFGLLGLGIFIQYLNLGPGILLVGALTLTLRILPIIILATQESIRAVPDSYREASYGLGASHWETTYHIVLPHALPGIMTGMILAISNAIGETAPLIIVGVATSIFNAPKGIMHSFGALPLQIFAWSDFPKAEFQHGVAPAAIVVLLMILLTLNTLAIIIRHKYKKS